MRIVELNHNIKKETRILNLQPKFQDGRIFLLADMHELEDELLKFTPTGRSSGHDDVVDTLSNLMLTLNKVSATTPRKQFNPVDYSSSDQNTSGYTYYLP
jgi:phage terminase large subunit-like protein